MTWFRVDDGWWSHRKTVAVSDAAAGLFIKLGCYSAFHLTDGIVPASVLPLLSRATEAERTALLRELSDAGSVVLRDHRGGAVVEIHDFLAYNPSRKQVLSDRKRRTELGRKGGVNSGQKRKRTVQAHGSTAGSQIVEAHGEPPSRPVPTRPGPSLPIETEGDGDGWALQSVRVARIAKRHQAAMKARVKSKGLPPEDLPGAHQAEPHLAGLGEEDAKAMVEAFVKSDAPWPTSCSHGLRGLNASEVNRLLAERAAEAKKPVMGINLDRYYV